MSDEKRDEGAARLLEAVAKHEASFEMGYDEGRRRTLIDQLKRLVGDLNAYRPDEMPVAETVARIALLEAERLELLSALRRLCEDFGDNDWEDNLSLVDVVEKHLRPYLEERRGTGATTRPAFFTPWIDSFASVARSRPVPASPTGRGG